MGTQTAIFVGPWGGSGGNHFDDGSDNTGMRRIVLRHGGAIFQIQITYDRNGTPVTDSAHGGPEGGRDEVNLDFPSEYLTGISGFYGTYGSDFVVRSLTFTSNMQTYGPYGTQEGTPFSVPISGGQIVGFAGRSGAYLDSIGIYIRQYSSD